jgi:hypothetical protein
MIRLLLFIALLFNSTLNANDSKDYSGVYKFDEIPNNEKGRFGSIYISYINEKTLAFSINLCRGAPSFNIGELQGEIRLIKDHGHFFKIANNDDKQACEWKINFFEDKLEITTLNNNYSCGFGYAVYANGTYFKEDPKKHPNAFTFKNLQNHISTTENEK